MPTYRRVRVANPAGKKRGKPRPTGKPKRRRNPEEEVAAFLSAMTDLSNEYGIAIDQPDLRYMGETEEVEYSQS